MALIFPISASIGQTYQSGSSNTYEWTGTYWKIKNVINFNAFSASISNRVANATNEQDLSYLATSASLNSYTSSNNVVIGRILQTTASLNLKTGSFATTGSNTFRAEQTVSGSILLSGSLVPATGEGTFTSSFSLGSPTNAWKDLYISHGSIVFVDAVTQETSSFTIAANQEVQYSNGITASYYEGDGSRLLNLPSTTNWNKREYTIKKTEQLTFSGDYILEDSYLVIEGSTPNSIGVWSNVNSDNNDGEITRTGNNTYRIDGANDNSGSGQIYIKRFFDTPTTMSIGYVWSNEDGEPEDWPIYQILQTNPTGSINNTNRLNNNSSLYETGSWTINVPANNWLAIGVYSSDSCCGSGSLNLTLPYIVSDDIIQYAENKSFKKEGSIFIGGNLLVKDSFIENYGKISVGGEVILIGESRITGTGIII